MSNQMIHPTAIIRALADAYRTRNNVKFAEGLILSPRDPLWPSLRSSLDSGNAQFPSSPELTAIFSHAPAPLLSLISHLVEYWKVARWRADGEGGGVGREEAEGEWKLFEGVYNDAHRLFIASPDNAWIGTSLKKLAENLLHLAFRAGRISKDHRYTAATRSVDRVRESFSYAGRAGEYSPQFTDDGVVRRGDIVFALGNLCWKVYTQIKAYTVFENIIRIYSQIPRLSERLMSPATGKRDRVGYWYWSGRLRLGKGDVRGAAEELGKAFEMCPITARKNLRAIFIPLLTSQILLGHFPSPSLLTEFNLTAQFSPLIEAIRSGNRAAYYECFGRWSEWYRKRGVWLVLREKGEVLLWRCLFLNTFKIYRSLDPARQTGRNSIPTSEFLKAARLSVGPGQEEEFDLVDVVSILSSLIDQSYIAGILSWKQTMLSLKGGPDDPFAGFPPVASVRPRNITAVQ